MATTQEVNKPQSLPPYPEIILKAIEELNEPNGSSKSAISNHIESTYDELPENHSTLLTDHLNQMKENGELVFAKNNYSKPDPSATPKRGRGRPPKPKDPLAPPPSAVFSPPRPRGRPPKDPNAAPKVVVPKASKAPPKASSGSGRGRGRPKKVARVDEASSPSKASVAAAEDDDVDDADVPTVAVPNASGRPRGRPPKVKTQLTEVSVES